MSGRNATKATRNHARDNYFGFDIARSPVVALDTGDGLDEVSILSRDNVRQVRLTFTSSEVGNGNPLDSGTLAGQDGGLAVRVQAEDASGNPVTGVLPSSTGSSTRMRSPLHSCPPWPPLATEMVAVLPSRSSDGHRPRSWLT